MNYINKLETDNKLYLNEIEKLNGNIEILKSSCRLNEKCIEKYYYEKQELKNKLNIANAQIKKLQKQQKENTVTAETIQQLEYVEKALDKKSKIDMNFVKSSISILLKAMKYNQTNLKEI